MTEDQENKWDDLIAKIDEAEQDDPIHEELKKEMIDFLNDELIKNIKRGDNYSESLNLSESERSNDSCEGK